MATATVTAIRGTARLGRRTKDLVKRLGPGDIAVIDHRNLDRIAAEELIASGDRLELEGGRIHSNGELIAEGRLLREEELAREHEEQRARIDRALHDFTENTLAHLREESGLLSGAIDLPETRTRFRDRHVLIVVRGTDHVRDLRALRAYIEDVNPILVGVDGGAGPIVREGLRPDVVLGDMDSAGEAALRSGAELIVHAYPDGDAPGAERLRRLALPHTVVPSAGTSQDVAMLLAYEKGASLIVSVGAHFNLVEFLERSRGGMSSTFLTRLRIGETLVDAKGVSHLYPPR